MGKSDVLDQLKDVCPFHRVVILSCSFPRRQVTSRDVTWVLSWFARPAKWHHRDRYQRSKAISMVTSVSQIWRQNNWVISTLWLWSWLPLQLLWAYLWNRMVDFVHFWQANLYDRVDNTWQKSLPCTQYFSHERISRFPWQPSGIIKGDPDHTKGGTLL